MTAKTLQNHSIQQTLCLYIAFELSHKEWKLAFGIGGKNARIVSVGARNVEDLNAEIEKAKNKFKLTPDCPVFSCYEAGRDGFWIHRYLDSQGVKNLVVDSSSIEVNRRKRRTKTDKLDARKLLSMLIRYHNGEDSVWSVVRVPSIADEDARRTDRELSFLTKERTRHSNRITSLLVTQGIVVTINKRFPKFLEEARLIDGTQLGANLKDELIREYKRMLHLDEQIKEIWKKRRQMAKAARDQQEQEKREARAIRPGAMSNLDKAIALMMLCGLGERSSWKLSNEIFWRTFSNRREVGSSAGLTGTAYNSGGEEKEQGISKAGNKMIRSLMVELAWFWIRYQPDSSITKWFRERFAENGKRMRRIGIVAVARRLLIALWRYVEFGEVPEGARFKQA